MSNYGKTSKQDAENTNDGDVFESMPEELRILIKRAFYETELEDICDTDEEINAKG